MAQTENPDEPVAQKSVLRRTRNDRLSIPFTDRVEFSIITGAFAGFLIGVIKGSQDSGLRFRAENAHRLPTAQTGWYLYHKSKNYNMMLGGAVEGLKQARRFALWTGLFFILEEGVDRGRAFARREYVERKSGRLVSVNEEGDLLQGQRDALSSGLAGLGTAGAFSLWNRLPLPTAARTAKLGASAGLAFGLLQDGLSLLSGRRVGYADFIGRKFHGNSTDTSDDQPA